MTFIEFADVPLQFHSEGPPVAPGPQSVSGGIRLFCGPQSDLFLDPAGVTDPPDAQRFLAPITGDFKLGAHLAVDFHDVFDSGVLLGYLDEQNWFKICAELDPEGIARVVSVVTRDGASDDANSWPFLPDNGVHLRISRLGQAFALHASGDGHTWRLVRYFTTGRPGVEPIKIGMLAQSPRGSGTTATFTQVMFDRARLIDVRDGS